MHTLESLRRQIDTATDLSSVVTTMKTLAAVSIHQYERAVEALADYDRTIEMGFQIVLRGEPFHLGSAATTGKIGAVVFGSDQGMCGQFNEEIASFAVRNRHLKNPAERWTILAVGIRAEGQLHDAGWPVDHTYEVPTAVSDITNLVQEMLHRSVAQPFEGVLDLINFHVGNLPAFVGKVARGNFGRIHDDVLRSMIAGASLSDRFSPLVQIA